MLYKCVILGESLRFLNWNLPEICISMQLTINSVIKVWSLVLVLTNVYLKKKSSLITADILAVQVLVLVTFP